MSKTALLITDVRNKIKTGGVKNHTIELLKFLKHRGYQVKIILEGNDDPLFEKSLQKYGSLTTIQHRNKFLTNNVFGFLFDKWISFRFRYECYDLVISNTGDVSKYWYLDILGKKRLHILHSLFLQKISVKNLAWKLFPPKVDVVTVSEYASKELKKNTELNNIKVVHNFSNLTTTSITSNTDRINILTVGQLVSYKGVYDWLNVAKVLLEKYDNLTFTWVGDGPEIPEIPQHLNEKIHLAGYHSNLSKFYQISDIYYHPSHLENHCLSILDALASGVPVIACDVGGNCESITSDVGAIVRKGDLEHHIQELEVMINSELVRRQKSANAISRYTDLFSKKAWRSKMSELIGH